MFDLMLTTKGVRFEERKLKQELLSRVDSNWQRTATSMDVHEKAWEIESTLSVQFQ